MIHQSGPRTPGTATGGHPKSHPREPPGPRQRYDGRMVVTRSTTEQELAWGLIAERYAGYGLVLPGDPSFICQAELCDALCCRAYSVAVNDDEVARLATATSFPAARFLECEDGEPINLPLERPFVLGREDDHCLFLGDDRGCEQYGARPDTCQLYPHQILFVNPSSGRVMQPSPAEQQQTVEALLAGDPVDGSVPLLLRHLECPGFTGPPTNAIDWASLFRTTYALQWGDAAAPAG